MFKWLKKIFTKKPEASPTTIPVKSVPTDIEKQIDEVVKNKLPSCLNLLKFNPSLHYWQSVIKAICKAESNFNVLETYWEKDLGNNGYDKVTGAKYLSEGLMQLSYSDHKYYACEFDWEADKNKPEHSEDKSIFNVRKNIECGMIILNKLVGINRHYIYNVGNYWAVLKPNNKRHEVFLEALDYYLKQDTQSKDVIQEAAQPSYEASKENKMKIAIIEGHGDKSKNSIDTGSTHWNGMTELDYTRKCTALLEQKKDLIKHEIKIFQQYPSVSECAKKVLAYKPDMSIELHTNAYNGKAKGCQVNVLSNDKPSFKLAKQFSDMFTKKYNRVLRDGDGVLEAGRNERGIFNLAVVEPLPASILVEPFFGDNKDEWLSPEEYVNFLIEYFNSL